LRTNRPVADRIPREIVDAHAVPQDDCAHSEYNAPKSSLLWHANGVHPVETWCVAPGHPACSQIRKLQIPQRN
jgi:hypothetical protein